MADPLGELFRHHAWATEQLLDFCAALSAEQLGATAAGTMGTVHATLEHLVAADERFVEALSGQTFDPHVCEGQLWALAELRSRFNEHVPIWLDLVGRAPELDVDIPPRRGRPEIHHAEDLLFTQAIHHGNDHRTHVCTVLSANGIVPPDLDEWTHWAATRQLTPPPN